MNLSIPLFHLENWATFVFILIGIGLLLFGYMRTRMFAFLSLAIGNVLSLVVVATRYSFWLMQQQPSSALQLFLTGLFLIASAFYTIGLAFLCVRRSPPTI